MIRKTAQITGQSNYQAAATVVTFGPQKGQSSSVSPVRACQSLFNVNEIANIRMQNSNNESRTERTAD